MRTKARSGEPTGSQESPGELQEGHEEPQEGPGGRGTLKKPKGNPGALERAQESSKRVTAELPRQQRRSQGATRRTQWG